MPNPDKQFEFTEIIALFLAEIIRSRRTSLRRAAEISRHVVLQIGLIHTEEEALDMLTGIERDFEEVVTLKQVLHFGYEKSSVRNFEDEIKEYAAKIFTKDMVMSSEFLQDAARANISIQELCLKYPCFSDFLYGISDKAGLVPNLHQTVFNKF